MSVTNTQIDRQPLRARSGSVAWPPLPLVVSLARLDRVHLRCTRRPLLHGPALPARSTCNRPRSLAALSPCSGRVHRWSLSRSPVASSAFPCNTPGRVHRRSLSRSPATSSPSPRAPRPAYPCGAPVARYFIGLSLPHPPRRARSGWTSWEHKTPFPSPIIDRQVN